MNMTGMSFQICTMITEAIAMSGLASHWIGLSISPVRASRLLMTPY